MEIFKPLSASTQGFRHFGIHFDIFGDLAVSFAILPIAWTAVVRIVRGVVVVVVDRIGGPNGRSASIGGSVGTAIGSSGASISTGAGDGGRGRLRAGGRI